MFSKRMQQVFGLLTLMALAAMPLPALAVDTGDKASDFGAGWEATPLLKPGDIVPATASGATAEAPASEEPGIAAAPSLEETLAPVMPFIGAVEEKLSINNDGGVTLHGRLNKIQNVLYGEPRYDDAGELLASLSEIFPAEAAKTRQQLMAEMANGGFSAQPQPRQQAAASPPGRAHSGGPRIVESYPANPNVNYQAQAQSYQKNYYQQQQHAYQARQDYADELKKRRRMDTLKSVGKGLGALALIGGALAGSYFLNKKLGNNNPVAQDVPDNYYYPGYGYPPGYGYGYSPYGGYGYGYSPYSGMTRVPGVPGGIYGMTRSPIRYRSIPSSRYYNGYGNYGYTGNGSILGNLLGNGLGW